MLIYQHSFVIFGGKRERESFPIDCVFCIETMFFAKKWNSIVELLWNFFVEVQVELLGNSISLYFSFFNTFQA